PVAPPTDVEGTRRVPRDGSSSSSSVRRRPTTAAAHDHRGDGVRREGNQEQHEAGGEQRGELVGGRFAVPPGDEGGDRLRAVLEDPRLDREVRGDDQYDRDGLTQRTAEREHRATDDAATTE